MSQTIKKSIGEGFGKGELYAALAYDVTDRFGGMKIKALMLNSTGRISFLDATAYIYSSATTVLDLVATTINITGSTATAFTYPVTITFNCTASAVSDLTITSTSASTSGSVVIKPLYVDATMSATGGLGRAIEGKLTVSGKLGSYGNAIKGYIDLTGGTGSTGLLSAICAEMKMSASATLGTFGVAELELVCPTSWTSGAGTGTNCISLIYAQISGATASQFDTNGFYLNLQGHTAAAGKFVSLTSQTLKCAISASTRYLVLSQTEDGLGLGTSGTAQVVTYDGTKPLSVYTTCASTDTSTSYEPVIFYNTLTGAGQVGGRTLCYMTTNVALGQWSNALKAQVVYGASGRTTGLGSALCVEMTMSAGTSSGTYAPLEIELNMGASGVTGTQTSLIYMSVNDAAATVFDDNGCLFSLNGVTAGANDVFYLADLTVTKADGLVKVKVNGTTYYMFVTTAINGGD